MARNAFGADSSHVAQALDAKKPRYPHAGKWMAESCKSSCETLRTGDTPISG